MRVGAFLRAVQSQPPGNFRMLLRKLTRHLAEELELLLGVLVEFITHRPAITWNRRYSIVNSAADTIGSLVHPKRSTPEVLNEITKTRGSQAVHFTTVSP